jgi:hypothetical protein
MDPDPKTAGAPGAIEAERATATPNGLGRAMVVTCTAVTTRLQLSLGEGESQLVVEQEGLEVRAHATLVGSDVLGATASSQLRALTVHCGSASLLSTPRHEEVPLVMLSSNLSDGILSVDSKFDEVSLN